MKNVTYAEAIRDATQSILAADPTSVLFGQGVADHKAIFGSAAGLLEQFGPQRVVETPLAEEGITGVAVGLALAGGYPMMTHIRMDFVLLSMNQIVNMAAKYRYMFSGNHEVPLLIRTVVGRSWGQGAQHSQSLQSLLSHIPGLTVIMPSNAASILNWYPYAASRYPNPVVSIEHRLLYDLNFSVDEEIASPTSVAERPWTGKCVREGSDVTVIASSIMVLEALRAAEYCWSDSGVSVEVIDIESPSHFNHELVLQSVRKTGRLVVADTSWAPFGLSSEIARIVLEESPSVLQEPMRTVGMKNAPCPTAKSLEDAFYPTMRDLVGAVYQVAGNSSEVLPESESFRDFYHSFRGPF